MAYTRTHEIVTKATEGMRELTERLQELERENEELKQKLGIEEAPHGSEPAAFDCLAVTQVEVIPFKEGPSLGHVKGLAQVVLNDQLVIRGLRIMDSSFGLFVAYPIDPFYKGDEFKNIIYPITKQLREHIEACVLEKYQAAIA